MNETLILCLRDSPLEPVTWGFLRDTTLIDTATSENFYELANLDPAYLDAGTVVGVLRGEDVAMRAVAAPPRSDEKFRAAARLLMEDELAEGPEALHIATVRRGNGTGAVFAIKRTLLDEWTEAFAEIELAPSIMLPDFCAYDVISGAATIVVEENRMVVALSDRGVAAEPVIGETLLNKFVSDHDISNILCLAEEVDAPPSIASAHTVHVGKDARRSGFLSIAAQADKKDAVNLLQGAYRKSVNWNGMIRPWQRAAMLAVACGVGVIAMTSADAMRSNRIAASYERAALESHQAAFPDFANIAPADYARRVLSVTNTDMSFSRLTNVVSLALEGTNDVVIDRIRFDARRSRYALNLRFADVSALEDIKAGFARQNVAVRETSGVRRSGGFYIGELEVGV